MEAWQRMEAVEREIKEAKAFDKWNALQDKSKDKSRKRGLAFVSLYAAAKQVTDHCPKRYPYLEYWINEIEKDNLAPKIDTHSNSRSEMWEL